MVAVVDENGVVLLRATSVTEDAPGYRRLLELLGAAADCLVGMEATGHYWRNVYAALITAGYTVALLNPLRTSRFAEEELQRTKTDAIDALGIARFAAQKRPAATQLPEAALQELRELVRFKAQIVQQLGDRDRWHRAADRRLHHRRGRRPDPLPQRPCAGQLCRRGSTTASVWQAAFFRGRQSPARQRTLATRAMDAGSGAQPRTRAPIGSVRNLLLPSHSEREQHFFPAKSSRVNTRRSLRR
jgi:hypothetical protein